jgi:lipopolysaccharide export system protein LptA
MAEDSNNKQYVIGKGKLYFDLFGPGTKIGTGERYLGNTPAFGQSVSQDSLDHVDSDQGLNVKDESIIIKNDLTGSFETDNISAENVAMFFGGDLSQMTVAAATDVVDADRVVTRGRTFQIGADDVTPMGTKKITNVVIKKVTPGALPADPPTLTAVTLAGNFEVDLERARIYVEVDAPDVSNGDTLRVTYDQEGYSREIIIAKGQQVSGALRFLADNPHGKNRDYYMPYVKITSNGDYALKGDEWQKMSFNYEVLKRDARVERQYIDGAASA